MKQSAEANLYKFVDFYNQLYSYRLSVLKTGLFLARNKLESYLAEICEQRLQPEGNKVKVTDFMEALGRQNRVKLTKMQGYVLQSYLGEGPESSIDYLKSVKLIASMIRKFVVRSGYIEYL